MVSLKEKIETVTIDGKEFKVITKESENCIGKDKLIRLLLSYGIRELKQEDF